MANNKQIVLKYTTAAGRAPDVNSMVNGEVFINHADKTLGFKAENGTIQYIVGTPGNNDNIVHKSGNETITGQKTFTQLVLGTAQKANWAADLAENYESDAQYPYGTLVQFGGKKEITQARTHANGVISYHPAFLMNPKDAKHGCWLPVAMIGRVPIRVKGRVEKFDRLVLSTEPGVAIVDNSAFDDEVIAVALKSKHTPNEGRVLCFTRFKI